MTVPMNLSNSGVNTLQTCERKFVLKYIARVPVDPDHISPDYFAVGNVFHKTLELTKHEWKLFNMEMYKSIVKSYNLDIVEDGAKIASMLRAYWRLHARESLEVVACEVKFDNGATNGIVDVIMRDNEHNVWWIVDLKTTGTVDANLPARIKRDPQLNLYAAFRTELAHKYNLDVERFAGIRYREAYKPRIKAKVGETFEQYTMRCEDTASVREIVVTVDELDSNTAFAEFTQLAQRAYELHGQFAATKSLCGRCNLNACFNYARPCEYFSWCYGDTFSESIQNKSRVVSAGEFKKVLPKFAQATTALPEVKSIEVAFDDSLDFV
jgi:RecB family exonuclease